MKYRATTEGIFVSVEPSFLDGKMTAEGHRYVWRYDISIENLSGDVVQLLNRHWEITDGLGFTEVVDGPGVVGEQPTLNVGTRFTYRSFSTLATPSGFMKGTYEMLVVDTKRLFNVKIPTFSLDSPDARPTLN